MRLPHLDQKIALPWGEAGVLARAVATVLYEQAVERTSPRPLALVLAFGPLNRVRGRLASRAAAERGHVGPVPRKPRLLTVRYDELAALLLVLGAAPPPGQAWGELQRASLNLSRYVRFP